MIFGHRRVIVWLAAVFVGAILIAVALSAKMGSGKLARETRSIEPFARVSVRGNTHALVFLCQHKLRVQVSKSAKPAVTIQTDENLIPLVDTHVSGDTLIVEARGMLFPTGDITVLAQSPKISGISDSASGGCIEIAWDLGRAIDTAR